MLLGYKYLLKNFVLQITAATCDFLTIVEELLQSCADCSIADNDGCLPVDVAESSAVKGLLTKRYENSWNFHWRFLSNAVLLKCEKFY